MQAQFMPPSLNELNDVFQKLKQSQFQGVDGVMAFESDVDGPTVGITVCTHGNEPSGLAALWYYLNEKDLNAILKKGTVVFTLNNMRATEDYFSDKMVGKEISDTRFCDMNLNRLPIDVMTSNLSDYEVRRAKQLYPIWQLFDVALDVHSTSLPSDPMLLLHGDGCEKLVNHFPVSTVISGFNVVMRDKLAVDFYGNEDAKSILLEAGSHEDASAFFVAITSVNALLHNLGMVEDVDEYHVEEYHFYDVYDAIFFPHESYRTVKIFDNFELVTRGQILAIGNADPIIAKDDGHALMCFASGRPPSIREEALFISRPVQKLKSLS